MASGSDRRRSGDLLLFGLLHSSEDAGLRGVPLHPASYDYAGQAAWSRDAGLLWDRTRRLRDRWDWLCAWTRDDAVWNWVRTISSVLRSFSGRGCTFFHDNNLPRD